MKYFCNPLNIEYKYQLVKNTREGATQAVRYRESADPSLILFNDLYYLFPSMTNGFYTSDDMLNWEFHKILGDVPVYDYAPDVRVIGDYIYFSASSMHEVCHFYRSKDPVTQAFEKIEGSFSFWDPNLFEDEDGRVYFYWGSSNHAPLYGVEMDVSTMTPLTEKVAVLNTDQHTRGFERTGTDHIAPKSEEAIKNAAEPLIAQLLQAPPEVREKRKDMGLDTEEKIRAFAYQTMGNDPFLEGAWMTKKDGKYFLQYSIPGTEYNIYGDGVFVSDNPLGPFELAKNNPYSYKPGGFINGAGHGSTVEDKNGEFWHTSTMTIAKNHNFERRLGLWKAGFDNDGELYCDQRYGDWPLQMNAKPFAKPDFMLLSYKKPVQVSAGIGAEYVTDENIRTWWRGESSGDTIEIDLQKNYDVHAIQVNFADDERYEDLDDGIGNVTALGQRLIEDTNKPTRWLLEGSIDGVDYFIMSDKSNAETDLSHDLVLIENGAKARFIKLTVIATPFEPICVSGIRVFGRGFDPLPSAITQINFDGIGDLDVDVSWHDNGAVGYNILWGYDENKLYHSYMVFKKNAQRISALIKDEPTYFRIDAFNESGITEGKVIKLR